jgi:hypothetical protein
MSTANAPKPARRRGTAAEEARLAIEQAEADGVARDAMTLRMTLRDASELKRDPKVAVADITFGEGGMRYLGVAVDQGGGVTQSILDRGDTGYVRGAVPEPPPAKPKAVRKKAVKKAAPEAVE